MFSKSILRSLVDGGTDLSDERRLIDRLAEFSEGIGTNKWLAVGGGTAQILLGLATATSTPVGFFAIVLGGYCLTKVKPNTLTNADDRELRFLSKHRNIFGVLKRLKQRGVDDEEILQSFEAMISRYNIGTDEIILSADHTIPAGNAIAGFEVVTAQIRDPDSEQSKPVAPQKRSLLSESLKSRQLPPAMSRNIGMDTRFGEPANGGAIDVPASTFQSEQSPVAVLNRVFQSEEPIGLPPELMQAMVETPYSTFVIGMSGAGKDILVYNTVSEIRKRYPHACIIGIDGKNAPTERPLWDKSLYNETIHFSMGDHPETYHNRLMEIFNAIDQLPPMTFIVFSELNGTRDSYISNGMEKQWNEVANKIRYVALQLNYAQKFLIATAQTANKVELGIGDGRQNVQFCLVSNGQQQSFINAVAKAAVFEGNAVKDTSTWQSAISRSTAVTHLPNAVQLGGVAYFHSALGRWLPMPRLQNPGSDRGTQSSTPQPMRSEPQKPVEPPPKAPILDLGLSDNSSNELEEKADKGNVKKPDLPLKEIMLQCSILSEWIEQTGTKDPGEVYSKWQSRKHGFTRPEIRYLLAIINSYE